MDFEEAYLQLQVGESDRIEAKLAGKGISKSLLDTICAFSNEPGLAGGYLFLGIEERVECGDRQWVTVGVSDSDKLQNELASLCRTAFNVPICPIIRSYCHEAKSVLLVHIPEANPLDKPIYIKSMGMEQGAFRRIGATDQRCTREDLSFLFQQHSLRSFELTALEEVTWEDLDADAISQYRRIRQRVNPEATELQLNDKELLLSLSAASEVKGKIVPTVAGLVLFGSKQALRKTMPMKTRVDYLLIEGTEWVPNPDHRYTAVEFRESLVTLMPRLLAHIMNDIPVAFSLDENRIQRRDIPTIPREVVREAVANALMHRDYSVSSSVQIIRYSNRLEFRNPGYSLKPLETYNFPGSQCRNEKMALVLHDLNYAEMKGTGMQTMRDTMRKANLSVPLAESDRGLNLFTLCLLPHHLFDEWDVKWLAGFKDLNLSSEEARALIVVREMGALTNADYRMVNSVDTLTASASLRRLRDFGLLVQRGQGSKTYYTPGSRLYQKDASSSPAAERKRSAMRHALSEELRPLSEGFEPLSEELDRLPPNFPPLSDELARKIQKCRKRAPVNLIKSLIKRLCALHPLTLSEIAYLLGRNPSYIRERYLTPMFREGELQYTYPENPSHPAQAYTSK